jgi:hypothetical protein
VASMTAVEHVHGDEGNGDQHPDPVLGKPVHASTLLSVRTEEPATIPVRQTGRPAARYIVPLPAHLEPSLDEACGKPAAPGRSAPFRTKYRFRLGGS